VVYALRQDRHNEAPLKRWGTRWFYRAVNAGGRFELPAGAGDFRLMDRQVVAALLALPERNRFMKGLYAWVGFRSTAVHYEPQPRRHGRSHFNLVRLARLSMDGAADLHRPPRTRAGPEGLALLMASARAAKREVALVAVSALVWLAATAGLRPLMLPDEGRYVGVAWEMLHSGDWLQIAQQFAVEGFISQQVRWLPFAVFEGPQS
jgi:hypothetical protein